MYYLYKLIFTKMSDVPNLQSYIPLNDEILVTLPIDNYVYMEQSLNCISNLYTALLMHAYWNSYPIKKKIDYLILVFQD